MDTETRPMHMLPTRDLLQIYGHIETESEGMDKKILHANRNQKIVGTAMFRKSRF